jgi:ankyrin repeat protein
MTAESDCPEPAWLHWAAGAGHEAVVLMLLEKEADILAFDKNGNMALHRAAWGGHKVVVEMLFGYGANVSAKDKNGRTALHMATEDGRKKVLLLLLEKEQTLTRRKGLPQFWMLSCRKPE